MVSTKKHQRRLGKQQFESRMANSLKYQLAINEQAKQGSGKKKNHHIRTHAGRKKLLLLWTALVKHYTALVKFGLVFQMYMGKLLKHSKKQNKKWGWNINHFLSQCYTYYLIYSFHFIDEDPATQRLKRLPKLTELVRSREQTLFFFYIE